MFINHDRKFIFIKTRKTAGSSVEKFLLDCSTNEDIVCSDQPYEKIKSINLKNKHKNKHRGHMSWHWIKKYYIGNKWDEYFKFTIERNSWDKVVSLYHWQLKTEPQHDITSFENYVVKKKHLYNKKDWHLYAANDIPIVDFVIDYNNLNQDLAFVCKKLNIPYTNQITNIKYKSETRIEKNYKKFYNNETKEIIRNIYKKEIDYFRYEF